MYNLPLNIYNHVGDQICILVLLDAEESIVFKYYWASEVYNCSQNGTSSRK